MTGQADHVVWAAAQREDRLVITIDSDFADISRLHPGGHAGVFRIRLSPGQQSRVVDYVASWFANPEQVASWAGCLVIATETKLRVRPK